MPIDDAVSLHDEPAVENPDGYCIADCRQRSRGHPRRTPRRIALALGNAASVAGLAASAAIIVAAILIGLSHTRVAVVRIGAGDAAHRGDRAASSQAIVVFDSLCPALAPSSIEAELVRFDV